MSRCCYYLQEFAPELAPDLVAALANLDGDGLAHYKQGKEVEEGG